jgi:lipopolysaccharide/colanic/teichoic acid biosynthesis glycosyltransferase
MLDSQAREVPAVTNASRRSAELRLKRWLDVTLSAASLLVLSPLLAWIALLVRLDSPGPIIFRQTRIGKGGRRFEIWKFRSMHCDVTDQAHRDLVVPLVRAAVADRAGAPFRAPSEPPAPDPRVTRAGRWLRRSRLDELPQLINVLRGEMSLVGPRPAVLYEYDQFDPELRERLQMPQGMTGLWQISGYDRRDFRRMYELDLEYVHGWSLWLDVKILALTLPSILRRRESRVRD